MQFQENELMLQKALAQKIITELTPILEKVTKLAQKTVAEYSKVELTLLESQDQQSIMMNTKLLNNLQPKLIFSLALKNSIEKLIRKNTKRADFVNKKLLAVGLVEDNFNKKQLAEFEESQIDQIDDDIIGVNKRNFEYRYVCENLFLFRNGKIDFSFAHNAEVLKSLAFDDIVSIVSQYPSCISTIPSEMFFDIKLKKNILKAVASYASDNSDKKSMEQINAELGNLLNFSTKTTPNVESFMAEVENVCNVSVRSELLNKMPMKTDVIISKLNCNEKSEFVPSSKKVPILSGGIAGDVQKTEEQESEELRIEQEKQNQLNDLINNMYNSILEQEEVLKQSEAEEIKEDLQQNIDEVQEEIQKKQIEERERQKELEEKEKELEMMKGFSKHDD